MANSGGEPGLPAHRPRPPAPVPFRVTGNAVSANFFRRSVRPGRPERGGSAALPARRSAGLLPPGSKTPGRRSRARAGGRLDRNIILLILYTPPKKVRAAAIFWHLAVFPSVFGAVPSRCRPSFAPDCPTRYDFPDVAQKGGREWQIERFLRPCPRMSDHSPPQGMGRCAGLSSPL